MALTDPREHLVDWLRDAYAMEGQAVSMLETQASRLENYPQVQLGIQEHLDTTQRQRDAIRGCLEQLGSDPSVLKEVAQKTIANVQGLFHAMSEDEVLKHALGGYAFEHFEAASYRMLSAAARNVGELRIAEVCERIQREEEDMADWLWEQMTSLTEEFLNRSRVGVVAKR
jgi:ferritin-like metal-binding protein YciE